MNKIDILFLFPPILYNVDNLEPRGEVLKNSFTVPYGALSVASHLKKHNINSYVVPLDCYLVDWNILSFKKKLLIWQKDYLVNLFNLLKKLMDKYNPRLVGISLVYTVQEHFSGIIVKYLIENYPNTPLIVGGNHASFVANCLFKFSNIDIVIHGEGELTCEHLIKSYLNNNNFDYNIKGISYKKNNTVIQNHNFSGVFLQPENIPIIDLNLLKTPKYFNLNSFEWYVTISRGCPFSCTFCTSPMMWGRRIRFRDHISIRKEITSLVDKGIKTIGIGDDTFIPESVLKNKTTILNEFKNITFFCQTRIEIINKTNVKILRRLCNDGLKIIYIGIESISPTILKGMNKYYKSENIIAALKKSKLANIEIRTFWIFGHPSATEQADRQTLKFIQTLINKKLIDKMDPHIFRPLPGTEDYNNKKIRLIIEDFRQWNHTGENIVSCHDIVDIQTGEIVYSAELIKKVFDEAFELKKEYNL